MGQELNNLFFWAIGGDRAGADLAVGHMVVRAAVIFVLGLFLIRLGKRRFYGMNAPLDLLMAIVTGSVLSRAINGSASFTATIAAALTLLALHWLFATLALRFGFVGRLVKGQPRLLIEAGEVHAAALRASTLSHGDLLEALHRAGLERPDQVKYAWLERGGEITVIPARDPTAETPTTRRQDSRR